MSEPSRDRSHEPEAGSSRLASEPGSPEELAVQWEAEKPPAAGRGSNLAAAAAVIALGVFALAQSIEQGVGSPAAPGAGTWPLVISLALIALGIIVACVAGRITDAEKFSSASWAVLLGLATMVGFGLVIPVIGFEIPGALLAFVWLRLLGREGWRTSIITSLVIVAAFYLIFVVALGTSIPHLF